MIPITAINGRIMKRKELRRQIATIIIQQKTQRITIDEATEKILSLFERSEMFG